MVIFVVASTLALAALTLFVVLAVRGYRARRHERGLLLGRFERLRDAVKVNRNLNHLPVVLHDLRQFIEEGGLRYLDEPWQSFWKEWLDTSYVMEGREVVLPAWTTDTLARLHTQLDKLKLTPAFTSAALAASAAGAGAPAPVSITDWANAGIAMFALFVSVCSTVRVERHFDAQRRPRAAVNFKRTGTIITLDGTGRRAGTYLEVTNYGEGPAENLRLGVRYAATRASLLDPCRGKSEPDECRVAILPAGQTRDWSVARSWTDWPSAPPELCTLYALFSVDYGGGETGKKYYTRRLVLFTCGLAGRRETDQCEVLWDSMYELPRPPR